MSNLVPRSLKTPKEPAKFIIREHRLTRRPLQFTVLTQHRKSPIRVIVDGFPGKLQVISFCKYAPILETYPKDVWISLTNSASKDRDLTSSRMSCIDFSLLPLTHINLGRLSLGVPLLIFVLSFQRNSTWQLAPPNPKLLTPMPKKCEKCQRLQHSSLLLTY